jgi:uncharacterized Zn finger protein
MPDERPEETPGPRFGRRPRQSEAPVPGGEAPGAPKKVRIGPRRPESEAPPPPPSPPSGSQPPRGGVRKPKGPPSGQNPSNRDGTSADRPQGGIKRKPGRNKGRNRGRDDQGSRSPGQGPRHGDPRQGAALDRGPQSFPEGGEHPAMGDSSVFHGAERGPREPSQNAPGVSRNARRRKRRKDRRDLNPASAPSASDVFEPSVPFEPASPDEVSFESDETDFALPVVAPPSGVSTIFPDTSFPDTSFIDGDDEGDDDETGSDLPVVDGAAPSEGAARESRSKRRRKKRRERQDPPQVDRGSGYWWAEQWMRSFEVLYGGGASRARLQKGRSYARRGQVTDLEVGPNGVIARVQGSRPKPYQVRLELNRLRRETWGRILHQLAGKAAFLAQLLEGTLPPEIEDVFFAAGARLFPHGDNDVRSRCTCPDPVVPCKHVAAVDYVLADALQRDPFLLFALRGKSRDQFLQDLRDMRGRENGRRELATPPEEDLSGFWRMGRLAESVLRPTGWGSGGDPARLIQSLGEPQLEGIREGLFLPMLESTYRQVSEGMRRLPKDD